MATRPGAAGVSPVRSTLWFGFSSAPNRERLSRKNSGGPSSRDVTGRIGNQSYDPLHLTFNDGYGLITTSEPGTRKS